MIIIFNLKFHFQTINFLLIMHFKPYNIVAIIFIHRSFNFIIENFDLYYSFLFDFIENSFEGSNLLTYYLDIVMVIVELLHLVYFINS
jgi:hypothetical protein